MTADRDAAPAAAEGADYWGYWGVYLPASRIPDEPVALFRYSDHADRWARESYPGRHELRANKAARPAPAAAPREGGEHRCVGCRSGLCEIPDARLCDDCQQGLPREAAGGAGDTNGP